MLCVCACLVSTSFKWVCQQVSSGCVNKYQVGVPSLSLTIIAPKILASVVALVVVGKSTGKLGSAASL